MIKNKREGLCVSYHPNGMLAESASYHEGQVIDKLYRWHRNGYMSDSINRVTDSTQAQVGWFDDGSLAYAGYLLNGRLHKKWQYFHHNGNLAGVVVYNKGDIVSKEYFNEDGSTQPDISKANREVSFKNGPEGWIKYTGKSLSWPTDLSFTNATSVVIGVEFTVNEAGKIEDAEITVPFHPRFDEIVLDMVRDSPAWIPAIEHNRKIKTRIRQPVTFTQAD